MLTQTKISSLGTRPLVLWEMLGSARIQGKQLYSLQKYFPLPVAKKHARDLKVWATSLGGFHPKHVCVLLNDARRAALLHQTRWKIYPYKGKGLI